MIHGTQMTDSVLFFPLRFFSREGTRFDLSEKMMGRGC